MTPNTCSNTRDGLVLVLGGTGKTGRRVASRLEAQGRKVRIGSRSAVPAFDWNHEAGWSTCLEGVRAVYINYAPDLAIDGARDSIARFVEQAKAHGVRQLVLLSGRGESEAQACERIVQESGLDWTVVRAGWFSQNFSEGAFIDMVQAGVITLPAGTVREPYIDADDIADVIAAALSEPGHRGEVYEVTGPRLMTLADVAEDLSSATGRDIRFQEIPHEVFVDAVKESGAPDEVVWLMDYLFSTVLDGRNAYITNGVERALKRPARDFRDYAAAVAAAGVWEARP